MAIMTDYTAALRVKRLYKPAVNPTHTPTNALNKISPPKKLATEMGRAMVEKSMCRTHPKKADVAPGAMATSTPQITNVAAVIKPADVPRAFESTRIYSPFRKVRWLANRSVVFTTPTSQPTSQS